MNNLLINLRLWYWHLQISRDRPHVTFRLNHWRWAQGACRPWIELH